MQGVICSFMHCSLEGLQFHTFIFDHMHLANCHVDLKKVSKPVEPVSFLTHTFWLWIDRWKNGTNRSPRKKKNASVSLLCSLLTSLCLWTSLSICMQEFAAGCQQGGVFCTLRIWQHQQPHEWLSAVLTRAFIHVSEQQRKTHWWQGLIFHIFQRVF